MHQSHYSSQEARSALLGGTPLRKQTFRHLPFNYVNTMEQLQSQLNFQIKNPINSKWQWPHKNPNLN